MIVLHCPNCGRRNVDEFHYVGERHARPDPATVTPRDWRAYLYLRDNPAGWADETWLHRSGCRRYLIVERHTVTNEVRSVREASAGASSAGPSAGAPAGVDPGPPEPRGDTDEADAEPGR